MLSHILERGFFSFARGVYSVWVGFGSGHHPTYENWLRTSGMLSPATPNQAVELTATRLMSTLRAATFLFMVATHAVGRRSSPLSR
jgi:hypothetical protein